MTVSFSPSCSSSSSSSSSSSPPLHLCYICNQSFDPSKSPSIGPGCCSSFFHLNCLIRLLQAGGCHCTGCSAPLPQSVLDLLPTPLLPQKSASRQRSSEGRGPSMTISSEPHASTNPQQLKRRLAKELKEATLFSAAEKWFSVSYDQRSRQVFVSFEGPPGSLYSEGVFRLIVTFKPQHPFLPPVIKFTHQVFHPDISLDGQVIDSSVLKDCWSPSMSLTVIICHIRDMLSSTSVTRHGPPLLMDGPEGEVVGGLTRVVWRNKQVWLLGFQCGGLWMADPSLAESVTRLHTANSANNSLTGPV